MGIGFRQDNNEKKDNTKKDVQPKAKELFLQQVIALSLAARRGVSDHHLRGKPRMGNVHT